MKPIFEPGDFFISLSVDGQKAIVQGKGYDGLNTLSAQFSEQIAAQANAKLTSLGIDSETPEKLREWKYVNHHFGSCAEIIEKMKRLAELEWIIAQANVVYGAMKIEELKK